MVETIVKVKGFVEGDTFFVDGPMWYDGTAQLLKFNKDLFELHVNMKATDKFGEVDFVIKDGSVDLTISLEKVENTYRLTTIDNHNNGKKNFQDNLEIVYGETEGGFFSGEKEFVKISNAEDETTFTLESPDKVSIKTTAMPVSVDLNKDKT